MDANKNKFLKCICAAIHGEKIDILPDENIDWQQIIDGAERHNVIALLYSSLENIQQINKNLFNDIKRYTLLISILQIQHIVQVEKVLNEFNKSNIKIIVLKGIALRELYPKPEFRTMTDSDLLVNKRDLGGAKNILLKLGYIQSGCTNHLSFKHERFLGIDLHWTIDDKRGYGLGEHFDNKVWNSAITINVGKQSTLSLSWEYTLIYLIIHMAGHAVQWGFGIRQLCDFALVVEEKGYLINWELFYKNIKSIKIEKFTSVIFEACKQLFNINIPSESIKVDSQYVNEFIDYIYCGGVYGKRDLIYYYGNRLAYESYNYSSNYAIGVIKKIVKVIFPSIEKIKIKFPYVENNIILFPIAWIHNIVKCILKINLCVFSIPVSRKRYKLFKYLDL